jgi:mono/diheme cytochrome c family protein
MKHFGLIAGTVLLGATVASWMLGDRMSRSDPRIVLGQRVYAANCAVCHGARLEGQPDWQSPAANGRLPAPPHDETGHTWHHSDKKLLAIVALGTAAAVGGGYESDMPGFADTLSADDMDAVLAFIKSSWPQRESDYQRHLSSR